MSQPHPTLTQYTIVYSLLSNISPIHMKDLIYLCMILYVIFFDDSANNNAFNEMVIKKFI